MDASLQAYDRVPKVLIADDDPGIVRFLSNRCAQMKFEVQTAANGLQALLMAAQSRPDVLIVDVNMPEVDGLSVCLRMLHPGKTPIEVVVMTATSNPETVERCDSFGAYYARKGPQLWDSVRSVLAQLFPDMAGETAAENAPVSPVKTWERARILVVDDDPDVGLFFSSRFRKCGVDTLLASDGVHGYRMACKEQPSVIISDYLMPNGDAHYLLRKLRGTAETGSIPVFVLSSRRLDETTKAILMREISGRPGAARIFKKSLDTHELFTAIQKYCAFENVPKDF
jgi:CheY-like chemotaxis protein